MTTGSDPIDDATAELDRHDQLAAHRSEFLDGGSDHVVAYLDGNSLGRPLRATAARLADFVADEWAHRLIRSWGERWMDEPTAVGDRLGTAVLGAAPGQTIVGDSTSVLLYKLVRAAVAAADGRDEIVIDRDNFPTDRFILEGIAADHGLTIRWLEVGPAGGVTPDDLAPVLGDQTAVVVLSHVAYRSGFLADAATLTAQVHAAGALMLWDVCHSAGAVPIELDAWGVDLAVGCTYKYLNGGPGSPAFGYVSAALQPAFHQPIWGWMGSAEPFAMPESYSPAAGIRRLLSGTPSIVAMQPMKDMLDLIEQVGIDAIRAKSVTLTAHAIDLCDTLLAPLGVELITPRDPARRGSHITLAHPSFERVTAVLWKRGVIPDFRPPDGLRIGLSPLSTSFAELTAGIREIRRSLVEVCPPA